MQPFTLTAENYAEHFQSLCEFGCLKPAFTNVLKEDLHNNRISIEFEAMDFDAVEWDGVMLIKFNTTPSAMLVVNRYIASALPDECTMLNGNALRLWWD